MRQGAAHVVRRVIAHVRFNFLFYDLIWSTAVALGFVVWAEAFGGKDIIASALQGNRGAVYGALVSIFGSLLGFTLATMTIVVSWVSREEFDRLRRFRSYPQLWKAFHSTILCLGLAASMSVVAILVDRDNHRTSWVWYVVAAVSLVSTVRVFRCVSLLEKLIRLVVPAMYEHDDKKT